MKQIKLNQSEDRALRQIYSKDSRKQIKERCQAILLNASGVSITEISRLVFKTYRTVWTWVSNWIPEGINSLYDKSGRGRKPKTTESEQLLIASIIEENPRTTNGHLKKISEVIGKTISSSTLKRILRSMGYRWKRVRKWLGNFRDEEDFRSTQQELDSLKEMEDNGLIDLYFSDESGFNQVPVVPYAWQQKGQEIKLASAKKGSYNVFGIMSRKSFLQAYGMKGSINSMAVIHFIDDFCQNRPNKYRRAYLVIDNAPIHSSKAFRAKEIEWEKLGVIIKRLPAYCPELNIIEILWKKIKYQWMPLTYFEELDLLIEQVDNIIKNIENKYEINFE